MTNIRYLIDELNQIIVNASVQQEQSTNVNIRISSNKSSPMIQHQPVQQPMQKQPMTQPQTQLPQIKFIQAEPISVKSSNYCCNKKQSIHKLMMAKEKHQKIILIILKSKNYLISNN